MKEILKEGLLKCRVRCSEETFSEVLLCWVSMTKFGYWEGYRGSFCEKLPETSLCLMEPTPANSKLNGLLAKVESISYTSAVLYIWILICCQKFRVYFLLAEIFSLFPSAKPYVKVYFPKYVLTVVNKIIHCGHCVNV